MTNALATIWYADDGYTVQEGKLNGRRMAGMSFLEGYLAHSQAPKIRATIFNEYARKNLINRIKDAAPEREVETVRVYDLDDLGETDVLYYAGPTLNDEAWRRYPLGQASYSICGITHTTATKAVMEQIHSFNCAPIAPWDALICTSNAVKDTVKYQLELSREFMRVHLGAKRFSDPMLPVIPIGVNASDFEPDEGLRKAFRDKHKLTDDHIVIGSISRLSAAEKFDPVPYFLAVKKAATLTKKKLCVILCGTFANDLSKYEFQNAVREILSDIPVILVDGEKHENRRRTLSASDIFAFPVDNLQETFGISPLEGMSAGLPIVTTDWNGIKDTVSEDVGFRIPTLMPSAGALFEESYRHRVGVDSYRQYTSLHSGVSPFDVPLMAKRIAELADDKKLRKKMGEAGKKRVAEHFDWQAVIPQMQELWDAQSERRKEATRKEDKLFSKIEMPIAPPATSLFYSYPTRKGFERQDKYVQQDGKTIDDIKRIFELKNYKELKRSVTSLSRLQTVFEALDAPSSFSQLSKETKLETEILERAMLWLLKFDLIVLDEKK